MKRATVMVKGWCGDDEDNDATKPPLCRKRWRIEKGKEELTKVIHEIEPSLLPFNVPVDS